MRADTVPDVASDHDQAPEFLNQEEAAKFLGISVKLLRRLTKDGTVPAARLGERRWRYSRTALVEWSSSRQHRGGGRS
jgi:excisionase family DNA binding protein